MKIGRISENVWKRSVLQQIRTKRDEVIIGAGTGMDCAIFAVSGDACQTFPHSADSKNDTSVIIECVQEGFVDRGLIRLLQKAVNQLASRGGRPILASLSLLLPAETEESVLKGLMAEAEAFCHERQMQIAQAGGRVSAAVVKPYAVVTACGAATYHRRPACPETPRGALPAALEDLFHTVKAVKPGQDIVISKWIGLEGTAILAERYERKLSERYPAWLIEEASGFERYLSTEPEAAVAIRAGADAICNVSEGGIFAALWEMAEGAGVGLTVDLKKIPLRQETVEICNYCDANPYELLSGGCLLMTCGDGQELTSALEEAGIPAVVVGEVTDSNDRLILNDGEVRYLDRPHTDAIYG